MQNGLNCKIHRKQTIFGLEAIILKFDKIYYIHLVIMIGFFDKQMKN